MLRVAHSFQVWLPLTMTWAYNQVRFAPGVAATVVAEDLRTPEAYPWEPLLVASAADRFVMGAARRLGRPLPPPSVLRALRREPPAVVHSHFGYRGWQDLPLVSRLGARHVVTFYGHDVQKFPRTWPVWRRRYEQLFGSAGLFLCEGPHMAQTLIGEGAPSERVRVQRLGVELDRLRFAPRTGPGDGPVRVLIAGAFREKKGIPDALEAVARVRAGGLDVRVTVIGDAGRLEGEQREKQRILATIERHGLEDAVRLLGFQPYDALLEEAAGHHLFLSPSRHAADWDSEGGAPVSLIELAATGMPIVSTRHCDIPEVVVDGVTGLLADEGDVEGIAARLGELAGDPARWEAMGRAARAHVEARFDVIACVRELVGRYEALAAGEGTEAGRAASPGAPSGVEADEVSSPGAASGAEAREPSHGATSGPLGPGGSPS
jgi:colanic acid/amylovoran biosynthesis glycosyltransferase